MVIEAVYRNGVFEPTQPVAIREGTAVSVTVPDAHSGTNPWLEFAGVWSEETARHVEEAIEEIFEQVHPGDYRVDAQ